MYVSMYVHTCMCVEIEDNTVLYIYWCIVHMYLPIHTYVRMCKCVQCSQACYSISLWPCVDESVLSEVSAAAVLRRS